MFQAKTECVQCPLVAGLPQMMETQFNNWNLTIAEKEVCRSLLLGKSLKKISEERSTNAVTVRQQALAIYTKSGLSGRHDLAAYFLKRIFTI